VVLFDGALREPRALLKRLSPNPLFVLYLAAGVIAGSLSFALGQSKNLEVFRHASRALLAGRDLYDGSSVDWFKYSPTFALLFLPFAWMPAWLAAALWGAINFGAAFLGIDAITRSSHSHARGTLPSRSGYLAPSASARDMRSQRRRTVLLASLPGILLATDGDQANLLVAGLMLLAFDAFERNRTLAGALAVALGAFVKIFPLAAVLFALFHRDRERSLFRVIVLIGVGVVVPLIVLRPSELAAEYASWLALLRVDHANRWGWSLVTIARDDLGIPAMTIQIAAGATLAVPIIGGIGMRMSAHESARFRRLFAASLLMLIVLCNHRSEYTSFVISAIGVGLWFADGPTTSRPRVALLVLASIAHGPIMALDDPVLGGPFSFLAAHRVFHPLRLMPLFTIWMLVQASLMRALVHSARSTAAALATSTPEHESAAE
jgi:hypothetical protein